MQNIKDFYSDFYSSEGTLVDRIKPFAMTLFFVVILVDLILQIPKGPAMLIFSQNCISGYLCLCPDS